MTYLLAGALLGIAGSVHCAGMCGPLLLVVHGNLPRAQLVPRFALYHGSRILTYALLGVPAGYAARMVSFGTLGRAVAALAGVLLIASAAASTGARLGGRVSNIWSAAVVRLGGHAAMLARRHPWRGQIILGALNGVLPCGLVYAAVAGAAATGTVAAAVSFMIGFGAGTLPLLAGITLSAASIPAVIRRRLRFVVPTIMVIAGLMLVARAILPPEEGAHPHHHAMADIGDADVSSQIGRIRGGAVLFDSATALRAVERRARSRKQAAVGS